MPFSVFRRSLTLTREAAGSYASGVWVPGAPAASAITASVQPIDGETMQIVPEGRRGDARFRIFTASELRTARATPPRQADRVTIDGEEFEVVAVLPWQNGVIPHYEAVLAARAG